MNNKFSLIFLTVAGLSYFQENLYGSNFFANLRVSQAVNSNQQHQILQKRLTNMHQNAERVLKVMQSQVVEQNNDGIQDVSIDHSLQETVSTFKNAYKNLLRAAVCFNDANNKFRKRFSEDEFSLDKWKELVFVYVAMTFPIVQPLQDICYSLEDDSEILQVIKDKFHDIDAMIALVKDIIDVAQLINEENYSHPDLVYLRFCSVLDISDIENIN